MTKIAFIGDTHANYGNIRRVLERMDQKDIRTGFVAGDFGYWPSKEWGISFIRFASQKCEELGITLHWVDGNHEEHRLLPHDRKSAWEHHPYLIWHPRGEVFSLLGKRFLAYGGAQSVDRYFQEMSGSWFPEEYPSIEHFDRAMEAKNVDVMITHEAPAGLDLRGLPEHLIPKELLQSSNNMRDSLRAIIEAAQPRLVVHGHWHERLTTIEDGRMFLSLGCDSDPLEKQVVVIDLDLMDSWGGYPGSILEKL